MQVFSASRDRRDWAKYEIDAAHEWGMPGVKCSQCGQTWAMVGVAYPLVDLSNFPYKDLYQPWPVSEEKYRELRDLIRPLVPDSLVIPPGTNFGPLVGKAKGKFGDFAWLAPWTLLIHKDKLTLLTSLGLRLPGAAEVKIRTNSHLPFDYVELQIEPLASLSSASYLLPLPVSCPLCGRISKKPKKIIVDGASVPLDSDIFRIKDFPTYILVSERFANVIKDFNLSDILLTPIDTV